MNNAPNNHSLALDAHDVRKSFGDREAVAGITLQVGERECVGLLGPNGAGKTTFLRICQSIVASASGSVSVFGHQLPEESLAARAKIGVVPQDSWLDPDFNCVDNLLVYASYFGISHKTASDRVPQLLDFAGIAERSNEPVSNLSGGMKRRLALARSLINDPAMIFLDEPTTGLDPQARHLIWERLRRLRDEGRALLLTTHFMEEAERLCDRVFILDHGRVISTGSPAGLIEEHVEREVIELGGPEAASWIEAHPGLADRVVALGTTHYCYANDGSALAEALGNDHNVVYTRRPSGLEDVYLRLTGHALRE